MMSAWLAGSWAEMANAADTPEARFASRKGRTQAASSSRSQSHPSGDLIATRSQNRRYANRTKYIGQRINAPLGDLEIWVEWEMHGARIVLDCATGNFENSSGPHQPIADELRLTATARVSATCESRYSGKMPAPKLSRGGGGAGAGRECSAGGS